MDILQLIVFFIFGVTLPAGILSFLWSLILVSIFGAAPFVPISQKFIEEILSSANLKKGQRFFDLGSGDGRVLIMAVQKYGVIGTGVEINPFLYWYSKILSKIKGLKNIHFLRKNLMKINLNEAEVVFLYLTPKPLPKLKEKFNRECKKNTLIISHRFAIEGWENELVKIIRRPSQPTYYYLMPIPRPANRYKKL